MAIFSGKFYSSKTAKTGDVITFKDAGAWVESPFKNKDGGPKKQFQITINVGGDELTMNLNGTSIQNLVPVLGKDSAAWVEKQAKVELMKALVANKTLDVIVLHPIEDINSTEPAKWGE